MVRQTATLESTMVQQESHVEAFEEGNAATWGDDFVRVVTICWQHRRTFAAMLILGTACGLYWSYSTPKFESSLPIRLISPMATYNERAFWDPAVRVWKAQLESASAVHRQHPEISEIYVIGNDPLSLKLTALHRTEGIGTKVLQKILGDASSVFPASTPENNLEGGPKKKYSGSPTNHYEHIALLRDALHEVEEELRLIRERKTTEHDVLGPAEHEPSTHSINTEFISIEAVTWYPWYCRLQVEVGSVLATHRVNSTVSTSNADSAPLALLAKKMENATGCLLVAWMSLNPKNSTYWPPTAVPGSVSEVKRHISKTVIDPLLTGAFLGLLIAATWVFVAEWFVRHWPLVIGASET